MFCRHCGIGRPCPRAFILLLPVPPPVVHNRDGHSSLFLHRVLPCLRSACPIQHPRPVSSGGLLLPMESSRLSAAQGFCFQWNHSGMECSVKCGSQVVVTSLVKQNRLPKKSFRLSRCGHNWYCDIHFSAAIYLRVCYLYTTPAKSLSSFSLCLGSIDRYSFLGMFLFDYRNALLIWNCICSFIKV